ncbi:glycoside hydrolase 100 family protein [Nitrospina sp. 32_T5]|uniref:glycoside hydrolase 100 family protein n=1 Tax=unclassified Nitrospina TaxID=2638683 RepID=UPI003F9A31A3
MAPSPIEEARQLLEDAIIHHKGRPVGTAAARDPNLASPNYADCFIRDFFPAALVFLNEGKPDIVKNFLETVLELRNQQRQVSGHQIHPGVMPASFHIEQSEDGAENLVSDFGDRAIGRVAPVDSMMWWVLLLGAYVRKTGDRELAHTDAFQNGMRLSLELFLRDTFEVFPTLLVPDGSFMIDRRMGVYGHPLEVQALFYGLLQTTLDLLPDNDDTCRKLRGMAEQRIKVLRTYVRIFYWLDIERLSEIHRFKTEEFGTGSVNMLNIYPESIPDWLSNWIPEKGGYLVGNLGPGRMDFRFFAQGNLLAILFGLATPEQSQSILNLYTEHWDDLIGAMPIKICFPALEGVRWKMLTGSDAKNAAWSYHNGGNWPVLLWPFVAAALKSGRDDLAETAFEQACNRLPKDRWPEYYDGHMGRLIGRRANLYQTWSASGLLLANQLLEERKGLELFPASPDHGAGEAPPEAVDPLR